MKVMCQIATKRGNKIYADDDDDEELTSGTYRLWLGRGTIKKLALDDDSDADDDDDNGDDGDDEQLVVDDERADLKEQTGSPLGSGSEEERKKR